MLCSLDSFPSVLQVMFPPETKPWLTETRIELKKAQIINERLVLLFRSIRQLSRLATVVISLKIIMTGIQPLMLQKAGEINAFARLVSEFHLKDFVWAICTGGSVTAWGLERRGKRRAQKELSKVLRGERGSQPRRPT